MENQQGPAVQHRELCSVLCNNLMVTRGKGGGRDSQGVWDGHGHTAVFHMENQQGPAGQHRALCSKSCGSLDGRGVWGRMDTCTCVAEPLHCSPETITSLLMNYSPMQNKKFKILFKFKKKKSGEKFKVVSCGFSQASIKVGNRKSSSIQLILIRQGMSRLQKSWKGHVGYLQNFLRQTSRSKTVKFSYFMYGASLNELLALCDWWL